MPPLPQLLTFSQRGSTATSDGIDRGPWFSVRPGPDGKKARKPRHGTGKRWKVHYTDPDGRQRGESFDRRVDAERFKATIEATSSAASTSTPMPGRTLKAYGESWLPAQTFGSRPGAHRIAAAAATCTRSSGSAGSASWRGRRASSRHGSAACRPPWRPRRRAGPEKPSAIMTAAVDDGLIPRNPCRAAGASTPKAEARRVVPWRGPASPQCGPRCLPGTGRWLIAVPGSGCARARCSASRLMTWTGCARWSTSAVKSRSSGGGPCSRRRRAARSVTCRCRSRSRCGCPRTWRSIRRAGSGCPGRRPAARR